MSSKVQITVIGNLGDNPELRYTPTGTAVANFSVASTPRVRNGDNWEDGDTTWYRVSAWRSLAENVAETLQMGSRVIVHGTVQNREWEDKEGNRRYSLEIDAEAVGADLLFTSVKFLKAERETPEPEPEPEPVRPARRTAQPASRQSNRSTSSRR